MADTLPTPAASITDAHVGRRLVVDALPGGPQVGVIAAVSRQRGRLHLTVAVTPHGDQGPMPISVHHRDGDTLQLVPEDVVGPVSPTVAGR